MCYLDVNLSVKLRLFLSQHVDLVLHIAIGNGALVLFILQLGLEHEQLSLVALTLFCGLVALYVCVGVGGYFLALTTTFRKYKYVFCTH